MVGTVELKLAGETIGVVDLIAGQDVSLNPLLFTVARFREFSGQSVPQSCNNIEYYLRRQSTLCGSFLNGWNRRKPTRKIRRR